MRVTLHVTLQRCVSALRREYLKHYVGWNVFSKHHLVADPYRPHHTSNKSYIHTCRASEMRVDDLLCVGVEVDEHPQYELTRCVRVALRTCVSGALASVLMSEQSVALAL